MSPLLQKLPLCFFALVADAFQLLKQEPRDGERRLRVSTSPQRAIQRNTEKGCASSSSSFSLALKKGAVLPAPQARAGQSGGGGSGRLRAYLERKGHGEFAERLANRGVGSIAALGHLGEEDRLTLGMPEWQFRMLKDTGVAGGDGDSSYLGAHPVSAVSVAAAAAAGRSCADDFALRYPTPTRPSRTLGLCGGSALPWIRQYRPSLARRRGAG